MSRGDREDIIKEIDLRRAALSHGGDAASALAKYLAIQAGGGDPVATWSYNSGYQVRDRRA